MDNYYALNVIRNKKLGMNIMKFVKLSKNELKEMATFYKNVMATAYEGLFYREGKVIGKGIIEVVSEDEDVLQKGSKLIEARGWVENITLEEDRAMAEGSIELDEGIDSPTCHRLRGILSAVYKRKTGKMVEVKEVKCESLDDERCEFEIDIKGF